MQSKPGAPNVFYICNDGITVDDKAPMNWGITSNANSYDIDGSYIWLGPLIQQPNPWIHVVNFPAANHPNLSQIWERAAKKFEIFDVNVTTERSIFLATPNKNRRLCILVRRPSASEMDAAKYIGNTFQLNKSENGPLPYSFRRWLIGTMKDVDNRPGSLFFDGLGFAQDRFPRHLTKLANNYLTCITFTNFSSATFYTSNGNWFDASSPSLRDYPTEIIGQTVAHELAHLVDLRHDTKGGKPGDSGPDSYYAGHGVWAPIMGNPPMTNGQVLDQWAINEYSLNTNKENDIEILGNELGFVKPPCQTCDPAPPWQDRPNYYGLKKFALLKDTECWDRDPGGVTAFTMKFGYNVRIITNNDVQNSSIEGMIGFPYDFDILKFILPKGSYQFKIDNIPSRNLGSMLDPQIDIINCQSHRPKKEGSQIGRGVACDQNMLPGLYPEGINCQCISYDPCFSENEEEYTLSQNFGEEDGFKAVTASVKLSNRSIVYVRIRGGKEQTPDTGWSRYGSVGKYKLEIKKNGQNLQSSDLPYNPIPECRCQQFRICDDYVGFNNEGTPILYVQDEEEPIGTQNQAEAHIKEMVIILEGKKTKQKFLVYGPPLPPGASEDGKFCLTILDPLTNECHRQEFVTGLTWEGKKSSGSGLGINVAP